MSFPDMSGALWNLTDPMQFNLVKKASVDFEAVDTLQVQTAFDAAVEPLSPRALAIKPEGERRFRWWTIWTDQALSPGDLIQDETGVNYRVMNQSNWAQAGFLQYEIIETPNPPYAGS